MNYYILNISLLTEVEWDMLNNQSKHCANLSASSTYKTNIHIFSKADTLEQILFKDRRCQYYSRFMLERLIPPLMTFPEAILKNSTLFLQ